MREKGWVILGRSNYGNFARNLGLSKMLQVKDEPNYYFRVKIQVL